MKHSTLLLIVLFTTLLFLPLLVNSVSAQTQTNYYVTVKPELLGNAIQYTNVGQNVTLSFVAQWSYGPNDAAKIQNATAIIVITNQNDKVVDMLSENTTTGVFSFNYSTTTPSILNFTPTKLVTADEKEWNNDTIFLGENAYEFTSNFAQVYWDTFHVAAINFDTGTLGKVAATVNVTYQMLPESGLLIGPVHLSKIGQGLNVTINGVSAQEASLGIYTAPASSSWLSAAYINVKVSGYTWTTTDTAFGVTQNANLPLWTYGVAFASIAAVVALFVRFMVSKRAKNPVGRHPNFPFFGSVILAAASVISLYWGIVGFEGTVHTFNWLGLAAFGVFAFVVGVIGILSLTRRKYLPLTITAAIVPLIANVVVLKSSLDMYQLASPWILLAGALALSMLSGFFICNIDTAAKKQVPENPGSSL